MSQKTVLYFVKYPEPGKVKTRLAKEIGNERAAVAYRMLADANLLLLRSLESEDISTAITFEPAEREIEMKRWLSPHGRFVPQQGEHLGERLAHAFKTEFEQGATDVLALGSDTMSLDRSHIQEAFSRLRGSDVVLGPAKDGGYYLIGLKADHTELFQDIPWSTSEVLESTMTRARKLNLSYQLLEALYDLDVAENLQQKGAT